MQNVQLNLRALSSGPFGGTPKLILFPKRSLFAMCEMCDSETACKSATQMRFELLILCSVLAAVHVHLVLTLSAIFGNYHVDGDH